MVRKLIHFSVILLILIFFVFIKPARAASISLDGSFDDWTGQANIQDPVDDAQNDASDLRAFYFTTNPDLEMLYFMAERWQAGNENLYLRLAIDVNNNGIYSEPEDRIIEVRYHPMRPKSHVTVNLYGGNGSWLSEIAKNETWGESTPGARVEFGLTFTQLGIQPSQAIRLQLFSMMGSSISDTMAEVQWSPANALGWPLLIGLMFTGIFVIIRRTYKGL